MSGATHYQGTASLTPPPISTRQQHYSFFDNSSSFLTNSGKSDMLFKPCFCSIYFSTAKYTSDDLGTPVRLLSASSHSLISTGTRTLILTDSSISYTS